MDTRILGMCKKRYNLVLKMFSMRYFYLFLHMPKKMLVFVNFTCTYNVEMHTGFF
jgi:hypothetical protein